MDNIWMTIFAAITVFGAVFRIPLILSGGKIDCTLDTPLKVIVACVFTIAYLYCGILVWMLRP